jgi:hypothetical protein
MKWIVGGLFILVILIVIGCILADTIVDDIFGGGND